MDGLSRLNALSPSCPACVLDLDRPRAADDEIGIQTGGG